MLIVAQSYAYRTNVIEFQFAFGLACSVAKRNIFFQYL